MKKADLPRRRRRKGEGGGEQEGRELKERKKRSGRRREKKKKKKLSFVGCLTSQQHASVSLGRKKKGKKERKADRQIDV